MKGEEVKLYDIREGMSYDNIRYDERGLDSNKVRSDKKT